MQCCLASTLASSLCRSEDYFVLDTKEALLFSCSSVDEQDARTNAEEPLPAPSNIKIKLVEEIAQDRCKQMAGNLLVDEGAGTLVEKITKAIARCAAE